MVRSAELAKDPGGGAAEDEKQRVRRVLQDASKDVSISAGTLDMKGRQGRA